MARIHLICRGGRHLKATNFAEYESDYWVLSETLHEKKSEPSYFGGMISGHRLASHDEPSPGHVVLTIIAKDDCKNVAWGKIDTQWPGWAGSSPNPTRLSSPARRH